MKLFTLITFASLTLTALIQSQSSLAGTVAVQASNTVKIDTVTPPIDGDHDRTLEMDTVTPPIDGDHD